MGAVAKFFLMIIVFGLPITKRRGDENGGCSLKTLEMFFVHTTMDQLEKRNNAWSFWVCVSAKLGAQNHMIIVPKSPVFKMSSSHTKMKSLRRFQIFRV